MYDEKIRALRMERQHLLTPANETEYDALYRDLQPGQNVYWNGFGQPPTLSFRADFDDLAYNKSRQFRRELIKGRFAGGNLGWILPEDVLVESDGGYLLKEDAETLKTYTAPEFHSVYALHRNDPLYKAFEPALKSLAKSLTEGLPYDCDPLQYLLIDGVFHGAVVGHFRNGPYDLNDVRIDDASLLSRKEEIIAAVQTVNFGALPQRFMGKKP